MAVVRWQPNNVYGVVLNDHDSLAVLGSSVNEAPYKAPPRAPVLYIKPRNTHVFSGASVRAPDDVVELEIGATLGVVFAHSVARCTLENALEGVLGFVAVADLSVPHSSYYRPAIREKCFDDSCVFGNAIAPRASVQDLNTLEVFTNVNGVRHHEWRLERLIRSVQQLIVDVSEFITFQANDVLLVGVPIGTARAKMGDAFSVEIPGVGKLEASL